MPDKNEPKTNDTSSPRNSPAVLPPDVNSDVEPRVTGDPGADFARITQPHVVRTTQSFSGPIPPPEILAGYDRIQQGFADRIITMAESENAHRRDMERSIVQGGLANSRSQFSEARWGQVCAVIITVAALAAGCFAALNGHDFAGAVFGASGVGGIVTTFILGRSNRQPTPPPAPEKQVSKRAAKRQKN